MKFDCKIEVTNETGAIHFKTTIPGLFELDDYEQLIKDLEIVHSKLWVDEIKSIIQCNTWSELESVCSKKMKTIDKKPIGF